MELKSLFNAILLFFSSFRDNVSQTDNSVDNLTVDVSEMTSSSDVSYEYEYESVTLASYKEYDLDFDCAMPYPPFIESNQPTDENSSDNWEPSFVEAIFLTNIPIVHELPESVIVDLHRFEDYCEEKIYDVYTAIKEFNNFNYEKNQEIQYLSYDEQRKYEIVKQSQEKKSDIEKSYKKMHQVCVQAEKHREKITQIFNPSIQKTAVYFTQPKRVPKLWYDMHNLETVVQQLFTPKLRIRTHFDETTNQLTMYRMFVTDSTPKRFISLPTDYINDDGYESDGSTNDEANIFFEHNYQDREIVAQAKKQSTIEQFNNNILEQFTYSSRKDVQQIIIYYVFKYYENEVQDGTRKVYHYTQMLEQKKRSDATKDEIINFENRLADALQELQENTIEMERNRVIPELVELYNVENAAHKLLPQAKYLTKLIGSDNKRVITAFNPSESIQFNALNGPYTGDNAVAIVGQESERQNLEGPLHWDQNWTWDF